MSRRRCAGTTPHFAVIATEMARAFTAVSPCASSLAHNGPLFYPFQFLRTINGNIANGGAVESVGVAAV